MATNKILLSKGLKYLFGSLPVLFLAPVVIYNAFSNEKHPLYILVLSIGLLLFISAIYLVYKGITLLVKSLFNDEN